MLNHHPTPSFNKNVYNYCIECLNLIAWQHMLSLGFESGFVETSIHMTLMEQYSNSSSLFSIFFKKNNIEFQYVWCNLGIKDLKSRQYMINYQNEMIRVLIAEIWNCWIINEATWFFLQQKNIYILIFCQWKSNHCLLSTMP